MRLTRLFVGLVAGLGLLAGPAWGDGGPDADQAFFTGGVVYQLFDGLDDDVDGGDGFQLGIGRRLTDKWGAEIVFNRIQSDLEKRSGDVDQRTIRVDALRFLSAPDSAWQNYLGFGVGLADLEIDGADDDTDPQVNAGFGTFRSVTDNVALRGDLRAVYTKSSDVNPLATIAITYLLGEGAPPPPPPPPPDSDRDGVADAMDRCPGTSAGVPVDSAGCPRDRDGDGVADNLDQCPRTPAGVAVDSRGCPLDADGDGVPDARDKCPNTARGARVDATGCYREITKTVTIDLLLEFDNNSAALRPSHSAEIDNVVKFLNRYPTAAVQLEGHTDSSGPEAYNQALSERRAQAVRNYLVNQAGIAASRVTARGFGESRPKAPNDTRDGRQRNRRVAAVIQGQQKVE